MRSRQTALQAGWWWNRTSSPRPPNASPKRSRTSGLIAASSPPMVSEPFRLGLVGAGRMGATHLRALAGSGETPVVAVAEPVAALREAAAGAYGLAAYESVDQLLDTDSVDGVLIVTPSPTHLEVIEKVASAGVAILCEK